MPLLRRSQAEIVLVAAKFVKSMVLTYLQQAGVIRSLKSKSKITQSLFRKYKKDAYCVSDSLVNLCTKCFRTA